MSKQTKTWAERVLNAASKEKQINSSVLRKRLRISSNVMDDVQFHGTVMRTVRTLASDNLLKRVDSGVYTITKKGEKAVA
jgi:hypothetical protein